MKTTFKTSVLTLCTAVLFAAAACTNPGPQIKDTGAALQRPGIALDVTGSRPMARPAARQGGAVQLLIKWPKRSIQVIPDDTSHLFIEVWTGDDQFHTSETVYRPADGGFSTVRLPQDSISVLPAGSYYLKVSAFNEAWEYLATGTSEAFEITHNHETAVSLTLSAWGEPTPEPTPEPTATPEETPTPSPEPTPTPEATETPASAGMLSGKAIDATNGSALSGVSVSATGPDGSADQVQTTTGDDGSYSFDSLAAGTYTIQFSKEGYIGDSGSATVVAGEAATLNGSLSPTLSSGQMRIILTWDNEADLDSYLGILGQGVISYQNTSIEGVASLDLDDTDGQGPETTTIASETGRYRFGVHHVSGTAQSAANAKIRILKSDGSATEVSISGLLGSDGSQGFEILDGAITSIGQIATFEAMTDWLNFTDLGSGS